MLIKFEYNGYPTLLTKTCAVNYATLNTTNDETVDNNSHFNKSENKIMQKPIIDDDFGKTGKLTRKTKIYENK
eukprot:Pgem_evm1s6907